MGRHLKTKALETAWQPFLALCMSAEDRIASDSDRNRSLKAQPHTSPFALRPVAAKRGHRTAARHNQQPHHSKPTNAP